MRNALAQISIASKNAGNAGAKERERDARLKAMKRKEGYGLEWMAVWMLILRRLGSEVMR